MHKGEFKNVKMTFEYIFNKYHKAIVFFINKIVNSKQDAEELCGNVFIKLWPSLDAFDTEQKVKSFLYKCARNAALNFIRDRKNNTEELKQEHEYSADSESPSVKEELFLLLNSALGGLPKRQKQIIEAIILDGLTNEQVAIKFNKTEKTIRNLKNVAIGKIKNDLAIQKK